MPNLVVHTALPGTSGTRSQHPEIAGLYAVGDGMSTRYLLGDAVFESVETAVTALRAQLSQPRAAQLHSLAQTQASTQTPHIGYSA
jgi:hypothetical protein